MRKLALLLLLAGCAPATQGGALLLVSGGTIEGRWVQLGLEQFPLPEAPLAADAAEGLLYAAFPYQLLLYRGVNLEQSLALPGVPTFVRATPKPIVGLGQQVFRPDQGVLPYPATDALAVGNNTYWTNGQELFLGNRSLAKGAFIKLLSSGDNLAALTQDGLVAFWPSQNRFSTNLTLTNGVWLRDLYLLSPQGVTRYSPNGLQIGFRAGTFEAIAADGDGLLLMQNQQILRLGPSLEAR